jgi:hypothetical protein
MKAIFDAEILDTGYWILDTGYLILDTGYLILDKSIGIRHTLFSSRIQHLFCWPR